MDNVERDNTDREIEVMLDLDFIRSNPSPEVVQAYVRDQLRAMAQRAARQMLARTDETEGES